MVVFWVLLQRYFPAVIDGKTKESGGRHADRTVQIPCRGRTRVRASIVGGAPLGVFRVGGVAVVVAFSSAMRAVFGIDGMREVLRGLYRAGRSIASHGRFGAESGSIRRKNSKRVGEKPGKIGLWTPLALCKGRPAKGPRRTAGRGVNQRHCDEGELTTATTGGQPVRLTTRNCYGPA